MIGLGDLLLGGFNKLSPKPDLMMTVETRVRVQWLKARFESISAQPGPYKVGIFRKV